MTGRIPEPTRRQKGWLKRLPPLVEAESEADSRLVRARGELWLTMTKARRAGCTLGQIAQVTGLSKSRVQQIVDPEHQLDS